MLCVLNFAKVFDTLSLFVLVYVDYNRKKALIAVPPE